MRIPERKSFKAKWGNSATSGENCSPKKKCKAALIVALSYEQQQDYKHDYNLQQQNK